MDDQRVSLVDAVRKEEYTGEDRCFPCTVVNIGIALVVAAVASIRSRKAGVVVFAVSIAAIYLRGYLVPGTPTLTERYLPERVLRHFDHHPSEDDFTGAGTPASSPASIEQSGAASEASDASSTNTSATGPSGAGQADTDTEESFETVEKIQKRRENAVDPEQFLREAEVTAPTDDGADLQLTEEFASALDRELEQLRGAGPDNAAIADVFGVGADDVERKDREYPAITIGRRIRKWPSEGALLVDVATHRALADYADDWREVPVEQRVGILESLRTFQSQCPDCDGDVAFGDAIVESCCATYEVISFECLDCGERLLELDPATIDEGDGTGIRP